MPRQPVFRLSSRTKLIALAFVAVLLPTTVLSVIQYRSLVELEGKTKVAVQENLRQTLHTVTRRVEERVQNIAKKTLGSISYIDLEKERFEDLECKFAEIKQQYPEIDNIFAFRRCANMSGPNKDYAIFYSSEGLRRFDASQLKEIPNAYYVAKAYDSARAARVSSDWKRDYYYWQISCCQASTLKLPHKYVEYVFHPMPCAGKNESWSFAGFTLNTDYIQERFLPEIIPATLRKCDIDVQNTDLALAVYDEHKTELYASSQAANGPEVSMAFGPIFPRWDLALGYKNTTIEALARDNFQKNLFLTLFVFSLLVFGIILTLRATAREMKLAQAKSTFVSNVSHELKTPLALIRLFAETLELGRVKSSEKAHEYYRIINNESRRLTQLINNILDFSKIEAGRKEYEFVESDVAEVVEDVVRSYEYQIVNAGFEMKTEIDRDLPPVPIDRDAISQAVLNLINNAVKYSDKHKEVTVRVRGRDGVIAIEVADRGIGIPRSEHDKIFEKFYRVSTGLVHDTKGSGLGLALVKHIVEAHHGKILVDSAPGKGSKFTILIPTNGARVAPKEINFDAGGYKVAESPNN
ncbi:MAG TPA: HAMP domain-containing sensor histidine kinase [Blastocatellia bacterium]|nr:HAMP domain-containing sensor histidine kinase [Blastocatellia bacterium]